MTIINLTLKLFKTIKNYVTSTPINKKKWNVDIRNGQGAGWGGVKVVPRKAEVESWAFFIKKVFLIWPHL